MNTVGATYNRSEITSADMQQLGFEYQYLYFIIRLLQMRHGEEVGYEAKDDVHVVSATSRTTLFIQVKHTVSTNSAGNPANLTLLSADFWKTLSNWSKLISDEAAGRSNEKIKKEFISQSSFILVTNRTIKDTLILSLIQKSKDKSINGTGIANALRELCKRTKDETICQYINDVLNLSVTNLFLLFQKIEVNSTPSNLFDEIRREIRNKMVAEEYVNDVLYALYAQLKEDFFSKVTMKTHQIIGYDEWQSRYQPVFISVRTTLLPLRSYQPILPEHLEQQVFVKELVEIGAIDLDDNGLADIAEFTEHYLSIKMQLEDWRDDGKIDLLTVQRFHDDAKQLWKNIHRSCHRTTKNNYSLDLKNACACFDQTMLQRLIVLSTDLGIPLSNGEFILLANDKKIGWKYRWDQ